MRKLSWILPAILFSIPGFGQIDAGLFRYPDVSQSQIVFTYANDLWIVPKEGGTALKLSSPPGVEIFPKFSPDGKTIAFTGNYDGNADVYTIPVSGGLPMRITYHGMGDRVVDWHPDGQRILFASPRESGTNRFNQLFLISRNGGFAEKLPLPYGEFASFASDPNQMALVFRSTASRTWKRYQGGLSGDIYLYNTQTSASENISSKDDFAEEFPMWHGGFIYFISDRGKEKRMNLWRYEVATKSFSQVTNFSEYDVHFPSLGPEDIVFEAGGKLYLLSLSGSNTPIEVKVNIINDRYLLKPSVESAENFLQNESISGDGKRVVVEARGELFSLPAENGPVIDLTRSSGVAERFPAWSPDGKSIAYWSDESGEYELWIRNASNEGPARKLTNYGPGFRYHLYWSPDSRKLAFIDKAMVISIFDLTTNTTVKVDKALSFYEGNLEAFAAKWSPDSRWLAYHRDLENNHNAVFLYDYSNKKLTQVTNGFYNCSDPAFDPGGKYLFLLTDQNFQPIYSSMDNTFIYANSTRLAAIPLLKTEASPLFPKNDTVSLKTDGKEKESASKEAEKKGKKGKQSEPEEEKKDEIPEVKIDIGGLESRLVIMPPPPGNYANVYAIKGKLLYVRAPNTGAADGNAAIYYFDLDKREEKTIVEADSYQPSNDGEHLLVQKGNTLAMIKPEELQKLDKPLKLAEMKMFVDPLKEWNQLYTDAWRFERDFFYDPAMHGVDWNAAKKRYQKMMDGAQSREEVNFIIGELIAELNASHTYRGGGAEEKTANKGVGYLGIDWQTEGNFYKVKTIIRGAPWDAEQRSALDQPGCKIKEGDYILAVNGIPLTTAAEPYAAFQDLANKTVEITFNSTPSMAGAKTAIVQTLSSEFRLRNLAWIEANRKRVEEATNGQAGYVYVPSTGQDGQNELIRQFLAQLNKPGLVIDERFNSGGQIPDRFVEMLDRAPLAFWSVREGKTWLWPPAGHFGPKVMLINGWSGSGGDAFPDYFKKRGLGPLIGARTWGGLIGLSGSPSLIDGGNVTVPTFRMYNPDGTWFKEGHGVDPDIPVEEDLSAFAKGSDAQLERAIQEIKDRIQKKGFTLPARPPSEVR